MTNVGVDSSCIIYKTIIKMIKILNCRQIKITDSFFRLKQLFCDSVKKSGVEIEFLKHSRFSNFMGLSSEMKKLSKQQQQYQKKQIRQAQILTTLAIVGIASMVIYLCYNQKFTLRLNTMLKIMSNNLGKTSKQSNQSMLNLLVDMEKYLISNPYQYKAFLDSIFHILSSLSTEEKCQEIQQKIEQIYIRIIGHNFKSVTNQCLKNGLQKLMERRFFSQNRIDKKIIEVLLSQGSIKQSYLTLKYLQRTNDTNWILSSDVILKFITNYQKNIEKHKQYFSLVFSKIDESKLPIFCSYKKIQQSRISYLQKFVKRIVK